MEVVGERKPYDEITVEGELEIQFPAFTAKATFPFRLGKRPRTAPAVM
jgi:hypothetical protein